MSGDNEIQPFIRALVSQSLLLVTVSKCKVAELGESKALRVSSIYMFSIALQSLRPTPHTANLPEPRFFNKMPSYKFEIAKSVLNEADKNRILCLYLSSDQTSINWQKAAQDFGSTSVDGFRRMTQIMLKKIKNAGGLEDDNSSHGKSKKPGNKKRKAFEVESDSLDHGRLKPARKSSKRTCSVVKCELSGSDAEEESSRSDGTVLEVRASVG